MRMELVEHTGAMEGLRVDAAPAGGGALLRVGKAPKAPREGLRAAAGNGAGLHFVAFPYHFLHRVIPVLWLGS